MEGKRNSFALGARMFFPWEYSVAAFANIYFTSAYFGQLPLLCSLPTQIALEFTVVLIMIRN